MTGRFDSLAYSDDNTGCVSNLSAGWTFFEHPREFKVILSGEHRNAAHPSVYHYQGSNLADITHPYWTPVDYFGGAITLEWRHDLSRFFTCGDQLHYYDLKASFGYDTEDNPAFALRGEWFYQFSRRWTLAAEGMVHLSREWNAQGLWLKVGLTL